jgi:glycosyltransferase involved in cell wall biosynthesis
VRLLHVYPYYPPAEGFGGVLHVVDETTRRLSRRGHKVVVYTTDTGGPSGRIPDSETSVNEDGVRVERFRNLHNGLAAGQNVPLPVGLPVRVARTIDRFDVVHVHGYPHVPALAAAEAARRKSVGYVLTPHGTVNLPTDVDRCIVRRAFDEYLGGRVLRPADAVVALNHEERRRIKRGPGDIDRIERIPNGVDPTTFDVGEATAREFRERHGLADALVVAFVGRLHRRKGLDVLADVAGRFQAADGDWGPLEFVIVGQDDGYEESFRRQLDEHGVSNVTLLGYVPRRRVRVALGAADAFVLPSYSEGQPMSVLEALAAGTPVVASSACSLPEIERADAGLIVPPEVTAVKRGLEAVLADPTERLRFARNARELARNRFSWHRVLEELLDLYRDVAVAPG